MIYECMGANRHRHTGIKCGRYLHSVWSGNLSYPGKIRLGSSDKFCFKNIFHTAISLSVCTNREMTGLYYKLIYLKEKILWQNVLLFLGFGPPSL